MFRLRRAEPHHIRPGAQRCPRLCQGRGLPAQRGRNSGTVTTARAAAYSDGDVRQPLCPAADGGRHLGLRALLANHPRRFALVACDSVEICTYAVASANAIEQTVAIIAQRAAITSKAAAKASVAPLPPSLRSACVRPWKRLEASHCAATPVANPYASISLSHTCLLAEAVGPMRKILQNHAAVLTLPLVVAVSAVRVRDGKQGD